MSPLLLLARRKPTPTVVPSLGALLHEYMFEHVDGDANHFMYIVANVKTEKQLKYWTKIQRLIREKKNPSKVREMS